MPPPGLSSSTRWPPTDSRSRRDFKPINDQAILRALAGIPIESWSYKLDRKNTRHIGPTAQDFRAAFHVGNNSKEIGTLDEGGIALASVKGLYQLVRHQQGTITREQGQIAWLEAQVLKLERRRG